ncbi:MAG: glutathione binding-like protein [Nitrosomonadaceae bacterium]
MIDCYFWTTPNGYKVLVFLEETSIPYRIIPINISKGEQFDPKFLQISPNNKIPAVVDHDPETSSGSIAIFESGAILLYLAEKTARFIPTDLAARTEVLKWLFWQMSSLGPMLGQNQHFNQYAPEKIPYAIERYVNETRRLFKVLNDRLVNCRYISGEYSIADIACYPWVLKHPFLELQIDDFPYLKRWLDQLAARPAIIRAYKKGAAINTTPTVTEESRRFLFGPVATRLAK